MPVPVNLVQNAVRNGCLPLLKQTLAEHPEQARQADPSTGGTPLMDALRQRGNDRMVRALLPFSDLRHTDRQGYSALMLALCYGQSTALVRAMVKGSDLRQISVQGETALALALRNRADLDLVMDDLLPGSDATLPGLLILALQYDRTFRVAHALLVIDPSPRRFWDEDGRTALHHAVLGGHTAEHVRDVLAVSDPRQADHEHQTALHTAARFGADPEVVTLLIQPCDPNAPDDQGYTPLVWTMVKGHQAAFEALLPATDLGRKNRAGRNALDWTDHVGSDRMKTMVREQYEAQQKLGWAAHPDLAVHRAPRRGRR